MPDPATTRQEIPLFPLGTVLFPGGPLPLRIFEARYIALVRRCIRENSGFGVVLLTDGAEAGDGPTATSDVGTYAVAAPEAAGVPADGEPGAAPHPAVRPAISARIATG